MTKELPDKTDPGFETKITVSYEYDTNKKPYL
jgi:hypothetical protein